jgi:hypothetical protein
MGKLNKLVFPLTAELIAKYNTPVNRGILNNIGLVLPIFSEDYKSPTRSNVETKYGYTSPFVTLTKVPFEIEATCKDGREAIAYIFRDLIKIATADRCKYQGVIMHDYCLLDEDADIARGYTIRSGVLNYEFVGGSFRSRNNTNAHSGGIRILFTQWQNFEF